MEHKSVSSVCRIFYEKFSSDKRRVHNELVSFLIKHPSSRSKLEEWIATAEKNRQLTGKPLEKNHDYEDTSSCGGQNETLRLSLPPMVLSCSNADFTKCDVKSEKERKLGNENFRTKKLEKSLHHYNQAIKYSCFPHSKINDDIDTLTNDASGSKESCLSMALANRSAVYYELGESFYQQSLKDIELALKYGYPERLKAKLLLRKANIFANQGLSQAAQQCLETINTYQSSCKKLDEQKITNTKLLSGTSTSHSPTATIQSIDAKIDAIELQIKRLPHTIEPEEKDLRQISNVHFIENVNFASASENIVLKMSEPLGRHVIALTDLHEGDVLFKELPYASVLLPPFYNSHCHHCHKALQGQSVEPYFFPCSRCTQVIFCDDLCANAAEDYHIHECGWLDLLHSVGIAHLAVRIVLSAGAENVLKSTRNHSNESDLKNVELFERGLDNYKRVYSLIDHIDDMFEEDLFQYTLTACLLTEFLISKTSFLQNYSHEQQLDVGGALLRHICQLVCNAHAVTDILPDDLTASSLVMDEYQKRIATAIYPSASMMNHSCDSNIMFHFIEGKELVVKAARKIKKNGNVYNCYGPHFRRMPLTERQEILMQQYMFSCNCDKCSEEHQSGISFASQFQALKCDECREPIQQTGSFTGNEAEIVSCGNCGKKQSMGERLMLLNTICNLHERGESFLEQGRIREATETLSSCYVSASQLLFKYNSQFGKICDSLARCFVIAGKFKDAKLLLEQSLHYVERRFGKKSVEFSREFEKYQDVNAKC